MGTKFGAISIFVKDLLKMVTFYKDTLGVEIDWDGNGPFAEFKHEGIRFMMYERQQLQGYLGTEVTYPNRVNGTFELAIFLPTYEDVDREYERLTNQGVRTLFSPRNEPWGMRTFFILDPEDNLIEIGSWA